MGRWQSTTRRGAVTGRLGTLAPWRWSPGAFKSSWRSAPTRSRWTYYHIKVLKVQKLAPNLAAARGPAGLVVAAWRLRQGQRPVAGAVLNMEPRAACQCTGKLRVDSPPPAAATEPVRVPVARTPNPGPSPNWHWQPLRLRLPGTEGGRLQLAGHSGSVAPLLVPPLGRLGAPGESDQVINSNQKFILAP